MRHPFYRFHIKNKQGRFTILIGSIWEQGQRHLYTPAANTAFAKKFPRACQIFTDEAEAQKELAEIKKSLTRRAA